MAEFNKFELRAPSAQNLIDIFGGKWASDFSKVYPGLKAGSIDLFVSDSRPLLAAQYLGTNEGVEKRYCMMPEPNCGIKLEG